MVHTTRSSASAGVFDCGQVTIDNMCLAVLALRKAGDDGVGFPLSQTPSGRERVGDMGRVPKRFPCEFSAAQARWAVFPPHPTASQRGAKWRSATPAGRPCSVPAMAGFLLLCGFALTACDPIRVHRVALGARNVLGAYGPCWGFSNGAVATVTKQGRVHAVGRGVAVGRCERQVGFVKLEVVEPARIWIEGPRSVRKGGCVCYELRATDQVGRALLVGQVHWGASGKVGVGGPREHGNPSLCKGPHSQEFCFGQDGAAHIWAFLGRHRVRATIQVR